MLESELIAKIRNAWDDEEYTQEIDEALRSWTPHPEEVEACTLFLGKKWQEIPESVLLANCPNPYLIGRIPMAYYLPAFLLVALDSRRSHNAIDFLVNFKLMPPKKPKLFEEFCHEYDLLSQEQREAVADFLRFCRDTIYIPNSQYELDLQSGLETEHTMFAKYSERARRRIEDALDRYWGK